MNISETDLMLHQAHHEILLQIVAEERLARQARQAQLNDQATTIKGLAALFIRWGCRLMPSGVCRREAGFSNSLAIYPDKEPGDAILTW